MDYFLLEANERLERLGTGLMALEHSPEDDALVNGLFREAHSLKGAASVSGADRVATLCHGMEDILGTLRDGGILATVDMIDALLAATDTVRELVAARAEDRDENIAIDAIQQRLKTANARSVGTDVRAETQLSPAETRAAAQPGSPAPPDSASESDTADSVIPEAAPVTTEQTTACPTRPSFAVGNLQAETVRLPISMLESLADDTGELTVAVDRLRQRVDAVKTLQMTVRKETSRQSRLGLMNESLHQIDQLVRQLSDDIADDLAVFEPLSSDIHGKVLDTRMLPVSTLFDSLHRVVRDYCREHDLKAELVIEGAETRVDRKILEDLRDPIIHLLRNSLSHGIEPPAVREKRGKPAVGRIRLSTFRRGDRVCITCEDDGNGIDEDAVIAKAVAAGVITEQDAAGMSKNAIDHLILKPGLSTASIITDVSGRGVGMDVVLEHIEALRGTLKIETERGCGTRFLLELPASVGTMNGLFVDVAGMAYAIPTSVVVRTVRVPENAIQTSRGSAVARIDDQAIPFVSLAKLLGQPQLTHDNRIPIPTVIIRHRSHHVAIGVSRLLGTQTVVVKSLNDHVRHVQGVIGATILGNGLPALILELGSLLQAHRPEFTDSAMVDECKTKSDVTNSPILIVDDSITTRIMEQSILESAGYDVDTAVSAEEALQKVKNREYQLVISDVEMPGLNGFQLTRKLRDDERYRDTPVIIVTSLANEEHRREGLDAGANAYIAKGEFDQTTLLDTVERLVGL